MWNCIYKPSMKRKTSFFLQFVLLGFTLISQNYPLYGPEKKVNINGLSFDAMEPFLSKDDQLLFFNSLNSGGNTNLYYATRVNDTIFNYVGLVNGCYDPSLNHLDAVASLDSSNHFYWVSLRNYPAQMENLHMGMYSSGNVSAIKRVYGDFNVYLPGWLIMDAAISHQGDQLYYCNAFFNACALGIPCKARLGVAQQVNDTTFNKISLSDTLFSNVNDTNYLVYAPQVTEDGLELYYTRILKSTVHSEICVSVRSTSNENFSLPSVIHSNLGFVPEAASPSRDKQKLYYHQKEASGLFRIYLRYRLQSTSQQEAEFIQQDIVYPNPTKGNLYVDVLYPTEPFQIAVFSILGSEVIKTNSSQIIDMKDQTAGVYFLKVYQRNSVRSCKIIKE